MKISKGRSPCHENCFRLVNPVHGSGITTIFFPGFDCDSGALLHRGHRPLPAPQGDPSWQKNAGRLRCSCSGGGLFGLVEGPEFWRIFAAFAAFRPGAAFCIGTFACLPFPRLFARDGSDGSQYCVILSTFRNVCRDF